MSLQDVLESRERWARLPDTDPLHDGRLSTYPSARVTWVDPATTVADIYNLPNRFAPDYDPMHMMAMGVFGDSYWSDPLGRQRQALLPQNYPFTKQSKVYKNTRGAQCKKVNFYGRPASLTRDWWLDRAMICDMDPLGWFEWYCWYWLGRRVTQYDDWQIARWVNFKDRQLSMYYSNGFPGTRQAILHWAIRTTDLAV